MLPVGSHFEMTEIKGSCSCVNCHMCGDLTLFGSSKLALIELPIFLAKDVAIILCKMIYLLSKLWARIKRLWQAIYLLTSKHNSYTWNGHNF